MSKYSKGDVVRLNSPVFRNWNGELGVVVQIETNPYEYLVVRTEDGKKLAVQEYLVVDVTLEEVRQYYAVRPRRGFIVDGLMVDELEAGQEEAYETFQRAANKAKKAKYETILWAVFEGLALAMIFLFVLTGNKIFSVIGYLSSLSGMPPVTTRMVEMILVCREKFKERRKRKEDP